MMNWRVITGLLALAGVGAGLGLELYQAGRIHAGVVADGVDVAGLSIAEATAKIQAQGVSSNPPAVAVQTLAKTTRLSASELGWRPDPKRTAEAAFAVGRSGDLLTNLSTRVAAWRDGATVALVASVDAKRLTAKLSALAAPHKRAPQSAKLVYTQTPKPLYAVRPEVLGRYLDVKTAVWAYQNNPKLTTVVIPEVVVPAPLTAEQLQPRMEAANALLRPLKLVYSVAGKSTAIATTSPKSLTLTPSEVADLFFVKTDGLVPDAKSIETTVNRLSRRYDRSSENARYVMTRSGLVVRPEVVGFQLKRQDAAAKLTSAVMTPAASEVVLAANEQAPKVRAASLPDPNTFVKLASATTTYGGSPRARMINVTVAARHLDGYIVADGEEFNFNQAIGDISLRNGYAEALVIAGGRTVEGVGGGVCQVSTTAFRALYKAGLPIIERRAHAYRVRWYDPIVGFDAAVYQPSLNLRMLNDTGAPFLVRASTSGASITVSLYGPPSKRVVTVSRPRVLSVRPAPATLTQYVSYLAPGVRKQVDWAANGYTTNIFRTIRDERGSRSDSLYTVYRPWRAVVHVGRGSSD
jgi:vancomycin resistance protein YoaR